MRRADTARLLLLAAIWGASFLFMRIAAPALRATSPAEMPARASAINVSTLARHASCARRMAADGSPIDAVRSIGAE